MKFLPVNSTKRLTAILLALICLSPLKAEDAYEVAPDSSNFVIATLVTATPTDVIYSSFGHCALRLRCPSANLDYCFSLEMDARPGDYFRFFTGKAMAAVVAVPTQEFIGVYGQEGRGVTEHELNLTHHEKQKLWRILDEELVKPPHLKFDFLNTNCVMMSMFMIENCLIDEHLEFSHLPAALSLDNGDIIRYHSQDTPWPQFLYITLFGAACDEHYDMEYRLSPKMIVEVLQDATIVGDSTAARPALTGVKRQLLTLQKPPRPSKTTPTQVFTLLLAVVACLCLWEWKKGTRPAHRIFDAALLVTQTVIGLFLLYTSMVANLFGAHWNWYLIPFNPIPLLVWLFLRKSSVYRYTYLVYTVVLIIFLLMTPISSQIDLPHQLITATLALRTFTKYVVGKKTF